MRDRDPYLATAGHFFVQEYIRQEFSQWGSVEIHTFLVRGKTCRNYILNLPSQAGGSKRNRSPILIAAHYDAVPGTPGADDNATGVAVLLEFARVFAAEPTRYPLQLIAFDLEEYGLAGPSGASEYAAQMRQQKQPLRLMISLEMLGYCDSTPGSQRYPSPLERFYPNRGNFIALLGNLQPFGQGRRQEAAMLKVDVTVYTRIECLLPYLAHNGSKPTDLFVTKNKICCETRSARNRTSFCPSHNRRWTIYRNHSGISALWNVL